MNYLFFDIECANSIATKSKICSLGYVLVDENFNVLNKADLLINPDGPFLVNNLEDFKLKYGEEEFRNNPQFPYYYDTIKDLLKTPNTLIFGYSVLNDCQYLNSEIIYWKEKSIDYKCYDVQVLFKHFRNDKDLVSLESACLHFDCGHQDDAHDSLSDAYLTMQVLKRLCENKKAKELVEEFSDCKIEVKDYKIEKPLSTTFNNKKHLRFLQNVRPLHKMPNELANKHITISLNYECKHYKELCKIVQRIVDLGGKYAYDVNDTDIFVTYPLLDEKGKEKYDARLRYAKKLVDANKNISFISFEDLLKLLHLTSDELLDIEKNTLDVYFNGKSAVEKMQANRVKKIKKENQNTLGNRFEEFFKEFKK